MQNIKIKQLKKKLEKQWKFFEDNNLYSEMKILGWVADSVVLLNEIGVSDIIIKGFIESFQLVERKANDGPYTSSKTVRELGPFISEEFHSGSLSVYKYSDTRTYKNANIKIAYRSAMAILDKEIEDEKIVPKWLVNELEDNGNYDNIISSLEQIQSKYENRDSDGLTKNTITLLDSILDLDKELKVERVMSKKLIKLEDDTKIKDRFGVAKEFILALNNSRIIRNIKSVHKNGKTEYNIKFYDIPFLVSVTFAYLVITFLEITISTGVLIKNHKILVSTSPSRHVGEKKKKE